MITVKTLLDDSNVLENDSYSGDVDNYSISQTSTTVEPEEFSQTTGTKSVQSISIKEDTFHKTNRSGWYGHTKHPLWSEEHPTLTLTSTHLISKPLFTFHFAETSQQQYS